MMPSVVNSIASQRDSHFASLTHKFLDITKGGCKVDREYRFLFFIL